MEFLRPKDVTKKMKICRTALYEMISRGLFPRPFKYGRRSVWADQEVEAVMMAIARGYSEDRIKETVKTIERNRFNGQE